MNNDKPALSITQLDMLSKCGVQYERRYIQHERMPPGVALIVGKGVDQSVDRNMQRKIDTGALATVEEIQDAARDAVTEEWEKTEVALLEKDGAPEVAKAGAVDKAVRLSKLHAEKVAPIIQPKLVQRSWRITLAEHPFDLVGKTDIEEISGVIRDTKTSGKSPKQDEAHSSDQVTMYALARRVIDGAAEVDAVLDYLVDTKTPKYVPRATRRTDADFAVMLRRIDAALKAIAAGAFVPARQSDWWCSERWCGYASTCPYFRRPVTVAVPEGEDNGND